MKKFPKLVLQAFFAVMVLNSCKKENTSSPAKNNSTSLSINASDSTVSELIKKKVIAIKYPKKPKPK